MVGDGINDSPALKEASRSVVSELKNKNIRVGMLTGDNENVAKAIAEEVGIDDYYAEALPEDKAKAVQRIHSVGGFVAMVGDGINDAPALAAGDIGIAIGSGSDIALESADVVLLRGDLQEVLRMIRLSNATFRIIRQNLFWAFFYNICGIPLASGLLFVFGGPMLNPAFCAGAMACSSLTVVLNALRLKFFH
jgi:Cu+-exporting ATPase